MSVLPNLICMSVFTRLLCLSTTVVLLTAAFSPVQSQSYDVVYYTGGEAVHCDLIEVTDYTVRYRLHDLPDGEIYNELRDDISLIFKRNGDFLLPVESGVQWKSGSDPDYDNIVTEDSQVLAAHDIEEHEDIIYYHDALDSADGSLRTDEIVAIIYQDGGHRLFASVDEVAYALGGSLAFALSADDAIASTGSMAAPLSEDSLAATLLDSNQGASMPSEEDVMAEIETEEADEAVDTETEEATTLAEEAEADTETDEVAQLENEDVMTEEEEAGEGDAEIEEDARLAEETEADTETEESTAENVVTKDRTEQLEAPSATSEVAPDERAKLQEELELSDTDYEEFAAKAVNKAEYLNNYLSLLCNRTLDIYDKEQAKESALKLFVHDSTVVQVSSLQREEIEKYTINQYLEHLTLFDYDKVELLWRNVQYVTKFRLAPDGNYYGTITVEQVFRGLKDGKPIYEDITQKDIEIVLGNFIKEESGVTEYAWDVFLSDIGVEETRRL